MVRQLVTGERGFTLLEVMISVVLLTFGLLAVASVLPTGLGLGLYGKDQTRAASLAQQRVEYIKAQGSSYVSTILGDYLTTTTQYFDQNGGPSTLGSEYFDRDAQVQVWTWNGTQFVISATPYTLPAAGSQYVYRVSVAISWNINGFSSFQYPVGKTHGKGKPKTVTGPTGCVVSGVSVGIGTGCVQVSTFISP